MLLGMSSKTKSCEFLPCLTVILMLFFLASFTVTIVWQGLTGYTHLQWPAVALWIVTALLLLFASGIKYLTGSGLLRRKLRKRFFKGDFCVVKKSKGVNENNESDDCVFYSNTNEQNRMQSKKGMNSTILCEETTSLDTIGGDFTSNKIKFVKTGEFSGNAFSKLEASSDFDESKPSTSGFTPKVRQHNSNEKSRKVNSSCYSGETHPVKSIRYQVSDCKRSSGNQLHSQAFVIEI